VEIDSAQPRWNDTGVIQDQNVPRLKIINKVAKLLMGDLARVAVQNEESGLVAVRSRRLGYEFVRELKVELGCEHVVNIFKIDGR